VDTKIIAEFRVERCDDNIALPAGHRWSTVDGGEHLDTFTDPLDDRSPDEHRMHLIAFDAGDRKVRLEGIILSSEGIATNVDVDSCEGSLICPTVEDAGRQQDHPGAGPERRHPIIETLPQRIEQSVEHKQFGDRRGLPAGEDECIYGFELRGSTNFDRVDAEPGQRSGMKVNCSLQREDSDRWGHLGAPMIAAS
jgi:hypothetical protein